MAEKRTFLLRLPGELHDELQRWARDELRSLNAQIEYVLRESIRRRRKSNFGSAPVVDGQAAELEPAESEDDAFEEKD